MRAVLEARSPGIDAIAGTGERVPLPDASADLVTVSSAWHWLDPDRAVPELARLLRDDGRLALVWTSRRRHAWFAELDLESLGLREDMPGRSRERRHREVHLPENSPFTGIEVASFAASRPMSKPDLVAMLGTYSQVINAEPDVRRRVMDAAREAVEVRFPAVDIVEVPVATHVWRAERTPRQRGSVAVPPG